MTQVKWFKSNRRRFSSRTARFAGLLMTATLFGLGCSKGTGKPVNSESQNPQISANQNSSSQIGGVAPSSSAPMTVGQPATVKKPRKKRPTLVTYKDPTYGVSFQYPRKYMLKTGDDAKQDLAGLGPVPSNFVQPGGVTLVTVELPHGLYPGTDLRFAFFNVAVNRSLTQAQCGQFAVPVRTENGTVPDSKLKLGGAEFDEVEDVMKESDAKYYHVFENGACYEFALGLGTSGPEDEDEIKPVDRQEVFHKLEKILATVKIKPEAALEVAGPVHPSAGTSGGTKE